MYVLHGRNAAKGKTSAEGRAPSVTATLTRTTTTLRWQVGKAQPTLTSFFTTPKTKPAAAVTATAAGGDLVPPAGPSRKGRDKKRKKGKGGSPVKATKASAAAAVSLSVFSCSVGSPRFMPTEARRGLGGPTAFCRGQLFGWLVGWLVVDLVGQFVGKRIAHRPRSRSSIGDRVESLARPGAAPAVVGVVFGVLVVGFVGQAVA